MGSQDMTICFSATREKAAGPATSIDTYYGMQTVKPVGSVVFTSLLWAGGFCKATKHLKGARYSLILTKCEIRGFRTHGPRAAVYGHFLALSMDIMDIFGRCLWTFGARCHRPRVSIDTYYGMGRWLWTLLAAVYGHSERDDIVQRVSIDTYYDMGRWLWTSFAAVYGHL